MEPVDETGRRRNAVARRGGPSSSHSGWPCPRPRPARTQGRRRRAPRARQASARSSPREDRHGDRRPARPRRRARRSSRLGWRTRSPAIRPVLRRPRRQVPSLARVSAMSATRNAISSIVSIQSGRSALPKPGSSGAMTVKRWLSDIEKRRPMRSSVRRAGRERRGPSPARRAGRSRRSSWSVKSTVRHERLQRRLDGADGHLDGA